MEMNLLALFIVVCYPAWNTRDMPTPSLNIQKAQQNEWINLEDQISKWKIITAVKEVSY